MPFPDKGVVSKDSKKSTIAIPPDATDARPDAPAVRPESPVTTNVSGRVKHDDRGNAIWEWAMSTGAMVVESASPKFKKLANPTLSLVDEPPAVRQPQGPVQRNPEGTIQGYSPYDSGLLDKKAAPRKKDLRKLSEWLKLKKQAESLKSVKQ